MMDLLRGLPPLRYFIKTPGQKRHEEKIFERGRKKGRQEVLSEFPPLKDYEIDYEIYKVREAAEAEKQRMREGYEKRLGIKEEELQQMQDRIRELGTISSQQSQQYQEEIDRLRIGLEIVQSTVEDEEIDLFYGDELVFVPRENPLYVALYMRAGILNESENDVMYVFVPRRGVHDYLKNSLLPDKKITLVGLPFTHKNFSCFPRGSDVYVIGWEDYSNLQLGNKRVKLGIWTPEDYLGKKIRRRDEIYLGIASLARDVDSENGNSSEVRLLLDASHVPLPRKLSLALGHHLSEGFDLYSFPQLHELRDRAYFFTSQKDLYG